MMASTWSGLGTARALEIGHPSLNILGNVALILGALLCVVGLCVGRRKRPKSRWEKDEEKWWQRVDLAKILGRKKMWLEWGISVLLIVISVPVSLFLFGMRPFPATDLGLTVPEGISHQESANFITLSPEEPSSRGFIFYPGGKIDPQSYINILGRVGQECQCHIFIVKPPFNIAIFANRAVDEIIDTHPHVNHWSLGGHSLGGVVAAYNSGFISHEGALVLWASYPNKPVVKKGITMLAIYGELDDRVTKEDIANAEKYYPADAEIAYIQDADHESFGNYYATLPVDITDASEKSEQEEIVKRTADILRGDDAQSVSD